MPWIENVAAADIPTSWNKSSRIGRVKKDRV